MPFLSPEITLYPFPAVSTDFKNLLCFYAISSKTTEHLSALNNLFALAALYFPCPFPFAVCGCNKLLKITCEAYARRLRAEVHWSSENG